jgi:hypothetical protein
MTLREVLEIIQNRVVSLEKEKVLHQNAGNLDKVIELEEQISETQTTVETISNLINE